MDQGNNLPQITTNLLPTINHEAIDTFYKQVEDLVRNRFVFGFHYGPAYEQKPGKPAPPNILYKRGMQFFVDNLQLLFIDTVDFIKEESEHVTFTCKTKMFRQLDEKVLAFGEGSCSTDEGRFAYKAFDKISSREVREQAILRSHKDAVERHFNPSRFFPKFGSNGHSEPEPQKKPPPKQTTQEEQFKWKYTMPDMTDPEWFKQQLINAKSDAEITAFAKQFKMELSMFEEKIQLEISSLAGKRRMEVKK